MATVVVGPARKVGESVADVFLAHRNPVWRDKSDFIINAKLPERDERFEQLWARQISDDTFEICCIPFFLYDVALGDVVQTAPEGERKYVMSKVIRGSGRYVFRVWFGRSFQPREDVATELVSLGAAIEWSSPNLLAVDAADATTAKRIAEALQVYENQGGLEYETGRTS